VDKISIENIQFSGTVGRAIVAETLKPLSYEFEFGKSYAIHGRDGDGTTALSWIIGGAIVPEKGRIFFNGKEIRSKQLRTISWLVRWDEIKRFGLFSQSVKAQLRSGINYTDDETLIKAFQLTRPRLDRKLRQYSNEGYSAACAIGFVHGKRVFCFPHLRNNFVDEYRSL
jgi:ABC-type transport system involved in cytochrome bd biosynthesis fused ATPase/permease subunit